MSVTARLVNDLIAESEWLDRLVESAGPDAWTIPTPAVGWTVAHQIGHLLWTDRAAYAAATAPDTFAAMIAKAVGEMKPAESTGKVDAAGFVDAAADAEAARPRADVLAEWRAGRRALADALLAVPPGAKLPWFGPPMSAASMATARIMETWAHGLDVADALGITAAPTDTQRLENTLRHVAHLGVRTRDFAFWLGGLTPPAEPFRIDLVSPADEVWSFGPEDAAQTVTGSALDFCYLVTQRRDPATLDVVATGDDARRWLTIAQAFAGPPGAGRGAARVADRGSAL